MIDILTFASLLGGDSEGGVGISVVEENCERWLGFEWFLGGDVLVSLLPVSLTCLVLLLKKPEKEIEH